MSGKRTTDYIAVLNAVLEVLPTPPRIVAAVMDFEAAEWQAMRTILPEVKLSGCLFHYTQAIWRKIQDLGLRVGYMQDRGTHEVCRPLMALPLLPHEHAVPVFNTVRDAQALTPPLQELINYVQETWITGPMFKPGDWAVFKKSVRTNNDVEGWHARLNRRANRGQLPFYVLVDLLHGQAMLVNCQVELISQEKLTRSQREHTRQKAAKLNRLWDEYIADKRTPLELLDMGSKLIAPTS